MKTNIANTATIYCIHSSDAPQHAGELKAILQRMKLDNRISDFVAVDVAANPLSIAAINENLQGIIVLLTNGVEQVRAEIEKLLPEKHHIKLIEIIVDNLPYNNTFISFPQDLKPIRSSDNMNLVWKGIEQDLMEMFPKPVFVEPLPPPAPTPKTDSKKYLKLIGISSITVAICFLFLSMGPHFPDDNYIIIGLFAFFLPIIIFLLRKKSLEAVPLPTQKDPLQRGPVNWKQLLIKTGTALVFFLEILIVSKLMLLYMGLYPYSYPVFIAMGLMLLILFYRRKTARPADISNQNHEQQSPVKKYLKLFGWLLLFLFLSSIFWIVMVENLSSMLYHANPESYFEKDSYITPLVILTTLCLLIPIQRNQTK